MKLLTVIGARPQIIKAAALSRAIRTKYNGVVEERLLHTGQHYDSNMSEVFFDELGIPSPFINLNIGSGTHGEQTALMIKGIEHVLMQDHYDGTVLYGDTNSTLAGAVASAKLQVPVFHIEAGLRSYNMTMPEEQNRIVCDQLSSICFAPTTTAVNNLRREGFFDQQRLFRDGRTQQVILSGDVMYDNSLHFASLVDGRCDILSRLSLCPDRYILATIHRNYNTDSPQRLGDIFNALLDIADYKNIAVVVPLHPRTAKLLDTTLDSKLVARIRQSHNLLLIPPVSFLEMISLERNAHIVMTDSGGVQKEAFFYERPCIILRPETEWVEIVNEGAGILADADRQRILEAYETLDGHTVHFPPLFGDGHAAEHIINAITNYLK